MVYRDREPFFQRLPVDRLFTATAGIVPKDRRMSTHGNWAELRKPPPFENNNPSIVTVMPEKNGEHTTKLLDVYKKFSERENSSGCQSRATPISFSVCATPRSGPRGGTPTHQTLPSTPRTSDDPFTPRNMNPGAQFVHYDAVQQAWMKHAAGLRSVFSVAVLCSARHFSAPSLWSPSHCTYRK